MLIFGLEAYARRTKPFLYLAMLQLIPLFLAQDVSLLSPDQGGGLIDKRIWHRILANSSSHQDCHRSCFTCSGVSEFQCSTCSEKRLLTRFKTCSCPELMYEDPLEKKCLNIPTEVRQVTIFIYVFLVLITIFSIPSLIGNRAKHIVRLICNYQSFFVVAFFSIRHVFRLEHFLFSFSKFFMLDYLPNPLARLSTAAEAEKEANAIKAASGEVYGHFKHIYLAGEFHFFIVNAGSIIILGFIFSVIYAFIDLISKFTFNVESLFKRLLRELRWSLFIRMFEITLLPMTLYISLEVRRVILFGTIIWHFDFLCLIASVFIYIYGLWKIFTITRKSYYLGMGMESEESIKAFIVSYGALTSDLKIDKWTSLLFIPVQFLKKILVPIFTIGFMSDASLQLFSLFLLNTFELTFLLITQPFMKSKYNLYQALNNLMSIVFIAILYAYQKSSQSQKAELATWGVFIMVYLLIQFAINFAIVIFNLMIDLNHIVIHLRNVSSSILGLQTPEYYLNQVNTIKINHGLSDQFPPGRDIDNLIPTPHAIIFPQNQLANFVNENAKAHKFDLELSSNQTFDNPPDQISFFSNGNAPDGSPLTRSYSAAKASSNQEN